ncbi:MAG: hypothetical protein AB1846_19510 [Chloroflexota bacterium]
MSDALLLLGLVYLTIVWCGTLLAYRRNRLLPDDSPQKQKYSPLYIFIAPALPPILIPIFIFLLSIFSIVFGAFLVVFAATMLVFGQVALLNKLIGILVRLGDALLKIAHIILWPFYAILRAIFAPEQSP